MQPVLLGAHDHPWAHESHVRHHLIGCEPVAVDKICPDQASSAPETRLAVYCDVTALGSDRFMGKFDELSNERQRWACTVIENHVKVLYA